MEQQKSKSENEFIANAIKKTFVGLTKANKISRSEVPLSKLTIGLECGGSDGFSGISANPTLGYLTDIVIGFGGSAILSEFPELNGVEQELINRCNSLKSAKKFTSLMTNYNARASELGSGFYANPSPGNVKDGLITDAIKSAGAAKKGGTSPIVDVLDYTEQIKKAGLNLLCTPGNDVESTTGLAGSGANLILFTTGLGTPTGNPAVPVIKISSNSLVYKKMNDNTIPFEDSIFINQEAKYILSLLNDEVKSSSWMLTNGIHKIGRLANKEIILDDITVSRNHAFISVDDETVIISDENSTNGIFVNGELTDESVLMSGYRIQIGKFNLIITKVDKK